MKYEVNILTSAISDINSLSQNFRNDVLSDFKIIKEIGIDAVNINSLGQKLFEVKSGKVRSIFQYQKGQMIVVAVVFLKKGQRCPVEYIEKARRILTRYKELQNG